MKYEIKKNEFKEEAENLTSFLPYSSILLEFMMSRGYRTKEEIMRFFGFWEKDLRNVRKMKDGQAFIDEVVNAVKTHKNITVYGDYDGDGVMGTSIVVWVFRWLGIHVNFFINHRFNEGYGLNQKGMERLVSLYPETEFIITLDNGISAAEGIKWAEDRGIQVVVSDHHELVKGKELPDCPVVDEWRPDEDADARECMCGAELVRRLMLEVVKDLGKEPQLHSKLQQLVGFSGFATISDSVKLTPANHYIARKGIESIRMNGSGEFWCWEAFKKTAGVSGEIDETTIGYYFAPMVNAASRVTGESDIPVMLCTSSNLEEARKYAEQLKAINDKRKALSAAGTSAAEEEIKRNGWENDSFIIAEGNGEIGNGIAGLVCSHITEKYGVPALVLSPSNDPEVYKGSGRSISGVNLIKILEQHAELFETFGGHAEACGVAIKKKNVPLLREALKGTVQRTEPSVMVDFKLKPSEISQRVINDFKEIAAPFGVGFEAPIWMLDGEVTPTLVHDRRNGDHYDNVIQMKGVHGKFTLTDPNSEITCLYFNGYDSISNLEAGEHVEIVGEPSLNVFRGTVTRQFVVRDIVRG